MADQDTPTPERDQTQEMPAVNAEPARQTIVSDDSLFAKTGLEETIAIVRREYPTLMDEVLKVGTDKDDPLIKAIQQSNGDFDRLKELIDKNDIPVPESLRVLIVADNEAALALKLEAEERGSEKAEQLESAWQQFVKRMSADPDGVDNNSKLALNDDEQTPEFKEAYAMFAAMSLDDRISYLEQNWDKQSLVEQKAEAKVTLDEARKLHEEKKDVLSQKLNAMRDDPNLKEGEAGQILEAIFGDGSIDITTPEGKKLMEERLKKLPPHLQKYVEDHDIDGAATDWLDAAEAMEEAREGNDDLKEGRSQDAGKKIISSNKKQKSIRDGTNRRRLLSELKEDRESEKGMTRAQIWEHRLHSGKGLSSYEIADLVNYDPWESKNDKLEAAIRELNSETTNEIIDAAETIDTVSSSERKDLDLASGDNYEARKEGVAVDVVAKIDKKATSLDDDDPVVTVAAVSPSAQPSINAASLQDNQLEPAKIDVALAAPDDEITQNRKRPAASNQVMSA